MIRKHLLWLACVLALSACDQNPVEKAQSFMGGSMKAERMTMAAAPMAADAMVAGEAPPSSMVLDRSQMGDRKISETHNLSIETAYQALQARYQRDFKKCVEMGCQIINSNIQKDQGGNISARMAPEKLGAYLDFLATGEGKIESHQVSADDYTMEYSDTEAQNQNLLGLRDRLRNLLANTKVDNIEGILQVEQELNRVQTEIDQRTARLKILDKMTQMATVNVNYTVEYPPVEIKAYELNNTWKLTVRKFLQAVDSVVQFTGGVLPWIPVLFIGFWLSVRAARFAFGRIGSFKWPWRKGA